MNNTTVNNWKTTNFGELARFINGYAFKPADWSSNGRQIIRIEQLRNPQTSSDYFNGKLSKDYEVQDGDLIFSWSATLMLRIWNNGEAYLNQHLFKVLEKNNVDRTFLKYLIEYNLPGLINASHGSTMQHITRPTLLNFPVNKPVNPTEQQKIAEILSIIDEAIAKSDQLIAKYKSIKQGLMQDLFRYGIDENGQIRSEKTHKFKDSPLGRIPGGWNLVNITEITEKIWIGLVTTMTKHYVTDGTPLIRNQNIRHNYVSHVDLIFLNDKFANIHESRKLAKGDIVTVHTGDIGTSAVINDFFNGAHGFATINTRVDKKKTNARYLCWFFNTKTFRQIVDTLATGDGRSNLNLKDFIQLYIPLPTTLAEQSKIADMLESIDNVIEKEQLNKQKLGSTKQGLMNDLLTGKVRVNHLLN